MRNLLPERKNTVRVSLCKKAVSPVATNSILLKPFFDTRKYYFYYTEVLKEKDG